MRTRRRRSRRRTYSIAYLLSKQPKTLAKQPQYRAMVAHYHASDRLKSLMIPRRCYTLLHNARIRPENLRDFYRTYHLPADPFFPLFFAAKRGYLAERAEITEARRRYIVAVLRALPPPLFATIKYVGYLERQYNPTNRSPVWQRELFPTSKKQADSYARMGEREWAELVRRHLEGMRRRYRRLPKSVTDRVLACHVLELIPEVRGRTTIPLVPPRPSPDAVIRAYRRLSLLHHPDRGGDAALFIEIKRARDMLA